MRRIYFAIYCTESRNATTYKLTRALENEILVTQSDDLHVNVTAIALMLCQKVIADKS